MDMRRDGPRNRIRSPTLFRGQDGVRVPEWGDWRSDGKGRGLGFSERVTVL